jgi:hypothetical protein
MTPDQVIADLRAENKRLRAEIARKQIQLEKAWKSRAEIHTRLRHLTSAQSLPAVKIPGMEEPSGPRPERREVHSSTVE